MSNTFKKKKSIFLIEKSYMTNGMLTVDWVIKIVDWIKRKVKIFKFSNLKLYLFLVKLWHKISLLLLLEFF